VLNTDRSLWRIEFEALQPTAVRGRCGVRQLCHAGPARADRGQCRCRGLATAGGRADLDRQVAAAIGVDRAVRISCGFGSRAEVGSGILTGRGAKVQRLLAESAGWPRVVVERRDRLGAA